MRWKIGDHLQLVARNEREYALLRAHRLASPQHQLQYCTACRLYMIAHRVRHENASFLALDEQKDFDR